MTISCRLRLVSASGDACAKIYNLSLPETVGEHPSITSEIVWNSFYLHALLLHHTRHASQLKVPHSGEQADQLTAALNARNEQMVGVGQPEWAHACDNCEKILRPENSTEEDTTWSKYIADQRSISANLFLAIACLSACVMDGVCIGHPRCQVYHCTQRLCSPRDRHCENHRDLDLVCAIHGCDQPCSDGKRTCTVLDHRNLEEERRRHG